MKKKSDQEKLIEHLRKNGISNSAVLNAFAAIPREHFVNPDYINEAYADRALPLAHGQTISQPYVVAVMTQALLASQSSLDNVLEIGTGSGYQAAILSCLAKQVYTVERIESLYESACTKLAAYSNVHCGFADGREGWLEHAPYQAIIVTAASNLIPESLKQQLADGARLIIPVGDSHHQQLQLLTRRGDQFQVQYLDLVVFVPLLAGIEF